MSLTNPNKPVTEQRLSEFYQQILPFLGGMPDILVNKFSRADLYSTDEKMIGRWIDGKPVYQKTIDFGALPNKTTKSVAHNIVNLDIVVDYFAIARRSSDNSIIKLPIINDSNINYQCSCAIVGTNIVMESRNIDFSAFVSNVTIQYTKTTDSPVEIGIDTDYSTEEKIVGTWIDGKPVYQKSYHINREVSSANCIIDSTLNRTTTVPISTVGYLKISNGNWISAGYYGRCNFIIDENGFGVNTGDYSFSDVYVTIQYTKTTD